MRNERDRQKERDREKDKDRDIEKETEKKRRRVIGRKREGLGKVERRSNVINVFLQILHILTRALIKS